MPRPRKAKEVPHNNLGIWSAILSVTETDLYIKKKVIPVKQLSNGFILEIYRYWMAKRLSRPMLHGWLRKLLPSSTSVDKKLVGSIEKLYATWTETPTKSLKDKLERELFWHEGMKQTAPVSKDQGSEQGSYLGKYSAKLGINSEQILKGDLPTLKEYEITNGVMFELYAFWKKKHISPDYFVEWIRCLHPKKKRINKNIIKKVKPLKKRRDELRKLNYKVQKRILEKALFRIKTVSDSAEEEQKTLTLRCEHEGCTKKITFQATQKIKDVVHCQLHKTSKKNKKLNNLSAVRPMTADSIKEMIANSRLVDQANEDVPSGNTSCVNETSTSTRFPIILNHLTESEEPRESTNESNQTTESTGEEVSLLFCGSDTSTATETEDDSCVVCGLYVENLSGMIHLATVVVNAPERLSILQRLEKIMDKPLDCYLNGYMCSMCYTTLIQIEESQRVLVIFKNSFTITHKNRQKETDPPPIQEHSLMEVSTPSLMKVSTPVMVSETPNCTDIETDSHISVSPEVLTITPIKIKHCDCSDFDTDVSVSPQVVTIAPIEIKPIKSAP